MSIRAAWLVALVLSMVWIIGGFAYTLSSRSGSLLPLLFTAPALILARVAWRSLRRA